MDPKPSTDSDLTVKGFSEPVVSVMRVVKVLPVVMSNVLLHYRGGSHIIREGVTLKLLANIFLLITKDMIPVADKLLNTVISEPNTVSQIIVGKA